MTVENSELSIRFTVPADIDTAEVWLREALSDEGFGILTEIDVQATLRSKLGVDTEPYRILGACNPSLAHRALAAEPSVGVLLPCNVVLRLVSDAKTEVEIADPKAMLKLIPSEPLAEVASEARERLQRVPAGVKQRCSNRVIGTVQGLEGPKED